MQGDDKPLLVLEEQNPSTVFNDLLADFSLGGLPPAYGSFVLSYLTCLLRRRTLAPSTCRQALLALLKPIPGLDQLALQRQGDICALLSRKADLSPVDINSVVEKMIDSSSLAELSRFCELILIELFKRPTQTNYQYQVFEALYSKLSEPVLLQNYFDLATAIILSRMYCTKFTGFEMPNYITALNARLDQMNVDVVASAKNIICRILADYSTNYLSDHSPIGLTWAAAEHIIVTASDSEFRVSLVLCYIIGTCSMKILWPLPGQLIDQCVNYLTDYEGFILENVEDLIMCYQPEQRDLSPTEIALEILHSAKHSIS